MNNVKDFFDSFFDRVRDPFLFYLSFFFIVCNWKFFYFLSMSDKTEIEEIFKTISVATDLIVYCWPVLLALIVSILYPYISLVFLWIRKKAMECYYKIQDSRALTYTEFLTKRTEWERIVQSKENQISSLVTQVLHASSIAAKNLALKFENKVPFYAVRVLDAHTVNEDDFAMFVDENKTIASVKYQAKDELKKTLCLVCQNVTYGYVIVEAIGDVIFLPKKMRDTEHNACVVFSDYSLALCEKSELKNFKNDDLKNKYILFEIIRLENNRELGTVNWAF